MTDDERERQHAANHAAYLEQERLLAEARTRQTCYTCTFWHLADARPRGVNMIGHMYQAARVCALTRHSNVNYATSHDYGPRPALAWGVGGQAYWLQTEPTFACNQWQANTNIYRTVDEEQP